MPRALIVGAFGQDNPGDEALLAASVHAVRSCVGWEAVVATATPAETAERLRVATIPARAAATARAAAYTDALVVGGGTVFKELHEASGRPPGSLLRRAIGLQAAFYARGRPVAMIGVGAAPIARRSNRQLARVVARSADLLVLRDAESAALLSDLGVPAPLRVGADLAWLVAAPPRLTPVASPPTIGVAVSHLAVADGLVARMAEALRTIASAGHRIELEPWQGSPRLGPDALLANRLAQAIGEGCTVLAPPADLAEAIGRNASRAAVLAMRFHATVAAAEAGTRFLALAHEPKLAAIAHRLDQEVISIDDPATAIVAAVESSLAGRPPSGAAVAGEHTRAEATADLLGLVLRGGGGAGQLSHLDLVPSPVAT